MPPQQDAASLYNAGHFALALDVLDKNTSHRTATNEDEVLRACLLASTGTSTREAMVLAEKLIRQRTLSPAQRCRVFDTLGSCYFRIGQHRKGVQFYREAIALAEAEMLTLEECKLRLNLFKKQVHWLGPQAAAAGVSLLRRKVHHVSDRAIAVRFQVVLAELAAKLGLAPRARHHLEVAKALLPEVADKSTHCQVMLVDVALAAFEANSNDATDRALSLAALADEVGDATVQYGVYGNLAHLLAIQARYEEALEWLNKGLRHRQFGGGVEVPLRDTLMQIHLWRGALDDASAEADAINELIANSEDSDSFYGLWHLWTRVKWLYRIGQIEAGVELAMDALPRIERMADRNLLQRMKLLAADGIGRGGLTMRAVSLTTEAVSASADVPLEVVAETARIMGRLSAGTNASASIAHFARAVRIFDSVGNRSAVKEVKDDAEKAFNEQWERLVRPNDNPEPICEPAVVASVTERLAALIEAGAHPPLLASESFELLIDTATASAATLTEVDRNGKGAVVRSFGATEPTSADTLAPTRILIGSPSERHFVVKVAPKDSAAARGTILAIERIVHSAGVVAGARQQQREQVAFWPEDTTEQQLGLLCASERMLDLVKTTHRAAKTNLTVLIHGESGVGKELFAKALHLASLRNRKAFLPFNCASTPKDMLDSQLFGHRRGAFTGAFESGVGVIRAADGGTLFLDEIGEMSLEAQPKLLRFLESGEIHPLGEPKPTHVDVRIVAATNANLEQLVSEGKFREDLFYRLNVMPIHIPPLRERREEVPALVEHFIDKFGREMQKLMIRVADDTLEYLLLYRWPGNVRQLANEIRRMVALAEPGAMLTPAHLSREITGSRRTVAVEPSEFVMRLDQPLADATDQLERAAIERAMTASNGNNDQAAKILGLSRKGLYLKRQRLGLK